MISVIVVTYNSSITIIDTLESIYNQSFNEIELVISDDGSTDNTIEIVQNWLHEKKDRFINVRIVESSNTGVALNCNRGIRAASGDYIQIIAGDDILLPDALLTKYNYAKKNNMTVVFCKTKPFGNNQDKVDKMIAFCERGYEIIKDGYKRQKEEILKDNYIAGPSGGFYKADFIRSCSIGGGFDERYPMMEDYPFIYHYIYAGNKINMLDEILSEYRISDGSLCMKKGSPMNISSAKFFFNERLKQMLKEGKVLLAIKQMLLFIKRIAAFYLYHSRVWHTIFKKTY